MKRILVTGGCGFIGSNFVRYMRRAHPGVEIVNLDALTYAGNLENLADIEGDAGHRFVKGDITDTETVDPLVGEGIDAIVNFAAESHVDRSIHDPAAFVRTNVLGTQVLLDAARKHGVDRFLQISTDEVYGSLGADDAPFTESHDLAPNSPYAASKAGADLLARAYHKTFDLPVLVTRCSNNYGPYQFPEKLIPLFVANALDDRSLPLYGDGMQVRDWIHVDDHSRAVEAVLLRGTPGRIYNVGADTEQTNREITRLILDALGKPESLIRYVTDRPGHDRRYAMDASRIHEELGWGPQIPFEEGIPATVRWYVEHRPWWERVRSGEYRTYYERQYAARLGAT